MSRSARLLGLLQLLRRHRHPVSGQTIAAELGISLRTLYRDIATLQVQGARIDGAPGLGYLLRDGFLLPPLMFGAEEVEALVLGSRWVVQRGDARLAAAARDALAKVGAALPAELRREFDGSGLLVGPSGDATTAGETDTATIRQAIRGERKLLIRYEDAGGHITERTIWPFALGFFDRAKVVAAWCELRGGVRHFRTDRIAEARLTDVRYPQRREALMKAWRAEQGQGAPAFDRPPRDARATADRK